MHQYPAMRAGASSDPFAPVALALRFDCSVQSPPDHRLVVDGGARTHDLSHGEEAVVDDVLDLAFEVAPVRRRARVWSVAP